MAEHQSAGTAEQIGNDELAKRRNEHQEPTCDDAGQRQRQRHAHKRGEWPRAEIFCRFTASGVFSAAAGGSGVGGCSPPSSLQVDWIFGSTGVTFDSYAVTPTGRASDHSMVQARATLVAVE